MKKHIGKILSDLWILLFAAAFLAVGYWYATKDGNILFQDTTEGGATCKAVVQEIVSDHEIYSAAIDAVTERRIVCYAQILSGEQKGERVLVTQVLDTTMMAYGHPIEVGDRYFIYQTENEYGELQWIADSVVRTEWLLGLAIVFCLLVILFGKLKGLHTVLALILTCLSIFLVLIPSIANGRNIYLSTVAVCAFTILVTLGLVSGFTAKSLAASLGCMGGVGIAALVSLLSAQHLRLTGLVDSDSLLLVFINESHPIDMRALLFAGILIGALGATMDVGMSIAASLSELMIQAPHLGFFGIIRSGFTIGRDIMGTMANTLVLAYVGSGLHLLLLFTAYHENLEQILNLEVFACEILQAMAGSIGILFTIPTTAIAAACCKKYIQKKSEPVQTKEETA